MNTTKPTPEKIVNDIISAAEPAILSEILHDMMIDLYIYTPNQSLDYRDKVAFVYTTMQRALKEMGTIKNQEKK